MRKVYKIISLEDWTAAQETGAVPPADIDRHDGYIHLSDAEQVLETARLYFAGRDDLAALEFDADELGDALKWEASRGGALFPHLYAELSMKDLKGAFRLVPSSADFIIGAKL